MPSPEQRGFGIKPETPEQRSIHVQGLIVGRIDGEAAREKWLMEHAGRFRALFEQDEAFQALVLDEDVEGILEYLGKSQEKGE